MAMIWSSEYEAEHKWNKIVWMSDAFEVVKEANSKLESWNYNSFYHMLRVLRVGLLSLIGFLNIGRIKCLIRWQMRLLNKPGEYNIYKICGTRSSKHNFYFKLINNIF